MCFYSFVGFLSFRYFPVYLCNLCNCNYHHYHRFLNCALKFFFFILAIASAKKILQTWMIIKRVWKFVKQNLCSLFFFVTVQYIHITHTGFLFMYIIWYIHVYIIYVIHIYIYTYVYIYIVLRFHDFCNIYIYIVYEFNLILTMANRFYKILILIMLFDFDINNQ